MKYDNYGPKTLNFARNKSMPIIKMAQFGVYF